MAEFRQEFLDEVSGEALALIEEHFREVYPSRDVFHLDMDWPVYRQLEGAGLLRIFTARLDRVLIGYLWVILSPNLHSKGEVIATDDGFFVRKEHRGRSVARDLVKFAEDCLRDDGLKVLYLVGTEENPIDRFVERLGYRKIETKFKKVL